MEAYHILPKGQQTRTVLDPVGVGFTRVREVTFMVDSGPATGTVDSVQVPEDIATVESVQNAIERKIDHIDAVARLGTVPNELGR